MKKILMLMAVALFLLSGCGGDSPTSPDNSNNSNKDYVEIVSVTPANESAGLEGLVELIIEFDRPMSEVVALLLPDGLGFYSDDWLLKSADGKSWSRTIDAGSRDKEYRLIILEAIGDDGAELENPEMTIFTTRNQLPQGKISGKVAVPPTLSPVGAVILVYDANRWVNFNESIFDPDVLVSFGYVNDKSGSFEVSHLSHGNYYAVGLKYDFETGEDGVVRVENALFGIYGQFAVIPELEKIFLAEGATFDGVDFDMFVR